MGKSAHIRVSAKGYFRRRMKDSIESDEHPHVANASAIRVTIISDDFASGLRAKNFAERLADQLGCHCQFSDSFWRSDLLDCWQIANTATLAAADCDYLIVSLRGDRVLPFFARHWIEAQLDSIAARDAALIVLPDSNQGNRQIVEATRHHFRSLCFRKGVAFFSHAMTAPAVEPAAGVLLHDRAPDAALSEHRWTPSWTLPETQNDYHHEIAQYR